MQSDAKTPKEYLNSIPPDRRIVLRKLRTCIRRGLPGGFSEVMSSGMLSYVVPLKVYPCGYHTRKNTPLPFISLASQKQHIAIYHMALYADSELWQWFVQEYVSACDNRPNMGKCCIRLRRLDAVPYDVVERLAAKLTPGQWIAMYEQSNGRST